VGRFFRRGAEMTAEGFDEDGGCVLAIGAHPDDVVLGIGGLLAKLSKSGYRVVALSLSSGELSGAADLREAEEEEAARRLGVKAEFARFPDGSIPVQGAIGAIGEVIRRYNPVVAFAHSKDDTHQDHVATWEAAVVACRRVPTFLTYEGPSSLAFQPTLTLDVTNTWARKLHALAAYASQVPSKPLLHWVDAVARYRAWPRHIGAFCEGFRMCHSETLSIPRTASSLLASGGEEVDLFADAVERVS
jgi:LmbE family N-acetylglucosaminyl deacetylase